MKQNIRIRPAHTNDMTALAQLDLRCNPHAWSEKMFQSALSSPNDTIFIIENIENAQEIIGFIVWQNILDELELHLIATAPEYRRQGIATLLINQMIDFSKENQIQRIFLEVRASNEAAQALYQRFGFVATARRKNYYGTEDAVLMEKKC